MLTTEVRGLNAFSDTNREELIRETRNDREQQKVKEVIVTKWPLTRKIARSHSNTLLGLLDELGVLGDIIVKVDRVAIPRTMRSHLLKVIHEGHLGMVKCKQHARDAVYWP